MDHDYITASLQHQYELSLHQRRQRLTRTHWASYPALAHRSIPTVAAIVADAYHPDHNTVAAALLAAHRARPGQPTDTEMVLLLCAARPLVLLLDPTDRYRDSRASLWTSVARRYAVLDPVTVADSAVPFLVALLGRIRADAVRHPSEPVRDIRRSIPVDETELEALLARGCTHDVPDIAIARLYLAAASEQHGWNELTRYATTSHRGHVPRGRAARHRIRIAKQIGYVA